MTSPIVRRLERLEAEAGSADRERVAVIPVLLGEPEESAEARHYAAHPEDRAAGLTVLLQRFAPSPGLEGRP